MNQLLFVYGSLRDPQVQTENIGRIVEGTPDVLLGYGKFAVKVDDIVYPILVPVSESIVEGEILKLTKEELNKIDVYEIDAYRRIKVKLKSGINAWVYVK